MKTYRYRGLALVNLDTSVVAKSAAEAWEIVTVRTAEGWQRHSTMASVELETMKLVGSAEDADEAGARATPMIEIWNEDGEGHSGELCDACGETKRIWAEMKLVGGGLHLNICKQCLGAAWSECSASRPVPPQPTNERDQEEDGRG